VRGGSPPLPPEPPRAPEAVEPGVWSTEAILSNTGAGKRWRKEVGAGEGLLICLRSRRAAGCLGESGGRSCVTPRGEAREVRGKERYRTDCAEDPSGRDSGALSPGGHENNTAGGCGRGAPRRQRIVKGGVLGKHDSCTEWTDCACTHKGSCRTGDCEGFFVVLPLPQGPRGARGRSRVWLSDRKGGGQPRWALTVGLIQRTSWWPAEPSGPPRGLTW
jgi:hypothetical protein